MGGIKEERPGSSEHSGDVKGRYQETFGHLARLNSSHRTSQITFTGISVVEFVFILRTLFIIFSTSFLTLLNGSKKTAFKEIIKKVILQYYVYNKFENE